MPAGFTGGRGLLSFSSSGASCQSASNRDFNATASPRACEQSSHFLLCCGRNFSSMTVLDARARPLLEEPRRWTALTLLRDQRRPAGQHMEVMEGRVGDATTLRIV